MLSKIAQESRVYETVCVSRPKNFKKSNHILDDAVITIKKINEKSILRHTASAGMVFPDVRTEVRDCPGIGMERY